MATEVLPTPVGPNSAIISMRIGSQLVQISGSTVLLTGATGGIGQAIARALSKRGAKLILTGRRTDVLEPLAAELDGRALAVDLAERAELARLVAEAGEIDILVANAALPASGTLDSFSIEEVDRALEVNLRAPIILAHELAPPMVARGRGQLVFISSLSGKATTPGASIYSASKFGLRGFAGGLRSDLRPTGVGVSTVFPGFISDAGMFADANVQLPKGVGTSTPEQVADAVVRAIEKNRGEIDVAPLSMRLGTTFAGIAPELAANVSKRMGADDIARDMYAGQSDKR
jgi:short-subunit dehydrogenase